LKDMLMTTHDASKTLLNAIGTLEPVIRHHADDAERHRRLALPVVQALTDAGSFRMCVPRSLGGLEVPPLTFYRVVEAVARLDGSTGWCTFIGGSDGLVGASLAPQTAEEIFGRDPRVILAGSVIPAGTAAVVEGGYRVSGRWPYASGCQHCTWVFGGCHVLDGDQPRLTATGTPEVRMVLIPAVQATILEDTWEVSGLVGTGSHDFTVAQVFVPDAYTWCFGPSMPRGPHYQGPLYRFPLVGLFRLPVSAVALGIAQGAIEACLELAPAKRALVGPGVLRDQPFFQARIAEAVALVRAARAWLHTAVQQAWTSTLTSGTASVAERADLVLAAVHATRSAAEAVQLVYTVAGGTANYRHSALQRTLRDVHAVTQHIGAAPQQYEEAGRMVLGLEPLQPIVLW
jgi:alkylation response protein AidB-like acyl-CoA dehydrogenase